VEAARLMMEEGVHSADVIARETGFAGRIECDGRFCGILASRRKLFGAPRAWRLPPNACCLKPLNVILAHGRKRWIVDIGANHDSGYGAVHADTASHFGVTVMKALTSIVVASSLSLTLGVTSSPAQQFRASSSATATKTGRAVGAVAAALSAYTDFCRTLDEPSYNRAFTTDARIEYPNGTEGGYLTTDAQLSHCWSLTAQLTGASPTDQVRIFPTGMANSVFIQYGVARAGTAKEHTTGLALIQLRGDQIELIRVFSRD
jgi:hypothetical protein